MDLEQRLRQLVEIGDPDGTVTIRWLAGLVGVALEPERSAENAMGRDLTVDEVAKRFKRSASTVRGWLSQGELRGYKLNGRDWRVTRSAIEEYETKQRGARISTGEVDIGEWREAERT